MRITPFARDRVLGSLPLLALLASLTPLAVSAAEPAPDAERRRFDLPAGPAPQTLAAFAEASGRQIVFLADTAREVVTPALAGVFTPRAALDRLIAGTGLTVVEDPGTGALLVARLTGKKDSGATTRPIPSQSPPQPKPSMKTKNPLAALGTWLALAFAPAALAADGTGTVAGRVSNVATGVYLEKARITVEGTTLETFTDEGGYYQLTQVPAGAARVKASFTGLAAQTNAVSVAAGQTAQHDIGLEADPGRTRAGASGGAIVSLDKFVVSTSKEMDGAAIAINERRFAPNIKDVVAADEFGMMADGNVGELLKFVPGVTLSYIAGEAASISLDGAGADNVPITVGGFELASARINTNRAVELSQFSVNNIARIEVSHTPTPEIPGTALAGSINMVPRSAFERARPVFNASASFTILDRPDLRDIFRKTPGPLFKSSRKALPGFNFSYLRPVNDRFGFTLSGSTSAQMLLSDWMNNTWRGTTTTTNGTTFPDPAPGQPYRSAYNVRFGQNYSERSSIATTLDFKLSPNDSLSVSFQYGYFHGMGNYRTQNYQITRVLPGDFSSAFTHGAPGAGTITTLERTDDKSGTTYMPSIAYRHRGPLWRAEAGAGFSHSTNRFGQIPKGFFQSSNMSISGLTIWFDDNAPLRPGKITVTDGVTGTPVDPFKLSSFRITQVNGDGYQAINARRTGYANVRRDFFGRVPLSLKAGVDINQSIRDLSRLNSPTYLYVGPDGRANTADDIVPVAPDRGFSQMPVPFGFPNTERVSNKTLFEFYKANPTYLVLDELTTFQTLQRNSKYSEEIISAAYFRGDAQFFKGRLKLVGGVRAEQTNVKGEGWLIDPTLNYQRNASGDVILGANGRPIPIATSALEVAKLTNVERGLRAKKEYLRWFPSLNASYDVTGNLVARIGHYWSIGRPNLVQYAGALTLPDTESLPSSSNRFTINNAGIKAWTARSTRATLEYYFSRVGLISIGGFRRDIDNFFVSSVFRVTPEFLALYGLNADEYDGYDVSTQINSPNKARMEGYNVNYKQALTFLPEWARGVQVFANLNALRATGTGAGSFTGYIPRTINWGFSLSRPKYNFRINWNHRERARTGSVSGRGIEPNTYSWNAQRMYVDGSAEYNVSRRIAVFASVRNLNSEPEIIDYAGPNTPEAVRLGSNTNYGAVWVVGVKGSF